MDTINSGNTMKTKLNMTKWNKIIQKCQISRKTKTKMIPIIAIALVGWVMLILIQDNIKKRFNIYCWDQNWQKKYMALCLNIILLYWIT